jgi:hypothetical protein
MPIFYFHSPSAGHNVITDYNKFKVAKKLANWFYPLLWPSYIQDAHTVRAQEKYFTYLGNNDI